jgi:hypothetical protein
MQFTGLKNSLRTSLQKIEHQFAVRSFHSMLSCSSPYKEWDRQYTFAVTLWGIRLAIAKIKATMRSLFM